MVDKSCEVSTTQLFKLRLPVMPFDIFKIAVSDKRPALYADYKRSCIEN